MSGSPWPKIDSLLDFGRPQGAPGGPRRPPGAPGRPAEEPRRPQRASGRPKRAQKGPKWARESGSKNGFWLDLKNSGNPLGFPIGWPPNPTKNSVFLHPLALNAINLQYPAGGAPCGGAPCGGLNSWIWVSPLVPPGPGSRPLFPPSIPIDTVRDH